jgi:hypothetical protein
MGEAPGVNFGYRKRGFSMRVLKFQIDLNSQATRLPLTSKDKIILVANQRGMLTIWAEVQELEYTAALSSYSPLLDDVQQFRTFVVIATGDTIMDYMKHVGSAIVGDFVWHVYEIK